MSAKPNILIVDDETNIRNFLKEILGPENYQITTAESGEAALERIAAQKFDLALIDLKLPGIDGIEVLKTLRQESPTTTAIMLTAHASLETSVEALRQGAHDYLFKPCKPAELRDSVQRGLSGQQPQDRQQELIGQLQKMSIMLDTIRTQIVEDSVDRPLPPVSQPAKEHKRFLKCQRLTVDLLQHAVILDGQPLNTTPTEFDLLVYLMREAPRAIPPQELIRSIQGYDTESWEASNIVRRHIHRLRQKIKERTGDSEIIQTVRGVGYMIDETSQA